MLVRLLYHIPHKEIQPNNQLTYKTKNINKFKKEFL